MKVLSIFNFLNSNLILQKTYPEDIVINLLTIKYL